jgi:hypothetical protein
MQGTQQMDRSPVFHKQDKKVCSADFAKNIWCPHYRICLGEAALLNDLLDCALCDYLSDQSNLDSFLQLDISVSKP